MLNALRDIAALLGSGATLLLPMRVRAWERPVEGGAAVTVTMIAIAMWCLNDWFRAESDRTFDALGIATMLGAVAVLIGLLTAIRSSRRDFDITRVVGQAAAAAAWIGLAAIVILLGWEPLVQHLQMDATWQPTIWRGVEWFAAAWFLIAMARLGRSAAPGHARAVASWLVVGCLAASALLPSRPVFDGESATQASPGLLHTAVQYVGTAFAEKPKRAPQRQPRIDVERTYYRQPQLVARALAALQPSRPDQPEIYFLAAATFAGQAVFMREVQSARAIVDERLGPAGRSMVLINHRDTHEDVPLANTTNLEATLTAIGRLMNPDKDLLFLYITSHGNEGEIAVQFPGFSPTPLTPDRLQRMLAASGIKHQLIVLSACYSGSFIPALRNTETVIMTAARRDRTSFGCSDERDWTYFGNAFFNHALRQTRSLTDAFAQAKTLVSKWEADLKVDPSEPQISAGASALAKIDAITARIALLPDLPSVAPLLGPPQDPAR